VSVKGGLRNKTIAGKKGELGDAVFCPRDERTVETREGAQEKNPGKPHEAGNAGGFPATHIKKPGNHQLPLGKRMGGPKEKRNKLSQERKETKDTSQHKTNQRIFKPSEKRTNASNRFTEEREITGLRQKFPGGDNSNKIG